MLELACDVKFRFFTPHRASCVFEVDFAIDYTTRMGSLRAPRVACCARPATKPLGDARVYRIYGSEGNWPEGFLGPRRNARLGKSGKAGPSYHSDARLRETSPLRVTRPASTNEHIAVEPTH
jgi:hypothetical protein